MYPDLVFRRLSLDFDQKEAAVAMWMLDMVQARLASLERLRHQKSSRSGADTRAARPRYHLHFTPTSSSWLNQIERWFAEITRKRIRRGTFLSVRDLVRAIHDYVRNYNRNPQPFHWVASASRIVRKVNGYTQSLKTAD